MSTSSFRPTAPFVRDQKGVVHERPKYVSDLHPWVAGELEELRGNEVVTCFDCIAIVLPPPPWIAQARQEP